MYPVPRNVSGTLYAATSEDKYHTITYSSSPLTFTCARVDIRDFLKNAELFPGISAVNVCINVAGIFSGVKGDKVVIADNDYKIVEIIDNPSAFGSIDEKLVFLE